MAHVVIFGANGRTGRLLVQKALERGHVVTAAVRRLEAFADVRDGVEHPDRLRVIRVDAETPSSIPAALDGQEAAISSIAAGRKPNGLYSRGTRHIVDALMAAGVQRFICISSSAVKRDDPNLGVIYGKIISPLFMTALYTDMAAMEHIVRASTLDWTLVRPPRLLDTPGRGRWRLQDGSNPRGGAQLARSDLAAFVLDQLGSSAWSRRHPTIAW